MKSQLLLTLAISLITSNAMATDVECLPTFDRYTTTLPFVDVMRCVMAMHPNIREEQFSVELLEGSTWQYEIVLSKSTHHGHVEYLGAS